MTSRRIACLLLPLLLFSFPTLAQQPASLGGYGELHYNDVLDDGQSGQLDFHRFILFAGYDFNDWVSFRSELELEHTLLEAEHGEAEGGEVALEQAYIDVRPSPTFGVRAGLVLVPVGIINPIHEPPTFNGVERPNVDKFLIPTTWRESGIGIFGRFRNGVSYEAYLLAGLEPSDEMSAITGISETPQDGFESSVDNLALTGRLDYRATLNLSVGGAFYYSSLSSDDRFGDALEGVNVSLIEAHGQFTRSSLQTRAVLVYSTISNAEALNRELGTDVGASQFGGYLEVGVDVLPHLAPGTAQQLVPFVRYEPYDTQASVPDGTTSTPAADRRDITVGLTYKPTSQVALKADLQWFSNETEETTRQLNLGVGYNF